jgi:hypothetical protein
VPEVENQNAPVLGSEPAAQVTTALTRSFRDELTAALQDAGQAAQSETTEPVTSVALPAETVAANADVTQAASVSEDTVAPVLIETPTAPDPAIFTGTDADDTIVFTADLRDVQGGAGTDTLVVQTLYQDAQIADGENNTLRLDVAQDSPTLVLQDVERIAFEDSTLAFDEDGLAGQAYRLYQACFDRAPDAEGLGFWIKKLDAGALTLNDAAAFFLNSEEFAAVYAPPEELADVHYLALLYANVLDRAPDAEGFGFWRDEQAKGVTRADMLVYFSESAENVAQVASSIDDGIWYV